MFRPASRFSRLLLAGASSSAPPNPYDILGLSPTATEKEIKSAHRKLALKFHPDNNETGNADKFKEIQSAFDILKNSGWKYHHHSAPPDGSQPAPGGADVNNPGSYGQYYNPPGSTQENYVQNNGKVQAMVRLVVMWCLMFATARYVLSMAFPDLKGRKAAQDLMLRQLEEYENKKKQQHQATTTGKGNSSSEGSTMNSNNNNDVVEKGLQNFISHLQQQANPIIKPEGTTGTADFNNNNSNTTTGGDEFVSWGDLKNKNSNATSSSSHWPKPDYDPLSSARR